MPGDVPAALPLIAYILGLSCGFSLRDGVALIGVAILLVALRRGRECLLVALVALGIINGRPAKQVEVSDERFMTIEAPIDRDWSSRGDAFLLRVSWRENPLTIYARFPPPVIRLEKFVRAEGFVRRNDRGELTLLVKSPRLLAYRGALSMLDPAAWNRMLANRLRPFVERFPESVALVEALALGRGERLQDEIRDSYKRGGTYHLLVFSGLQIAFAAGAIAFLLRWLRAPRASDWLLLAFSILAPLFIGPTASVSRSSLGIGLYALTRILKRPTTLENLWCVAALLRLIVVPGDLTNAAFQLTFAGAGALLFIGKTLANGRKRWFTYALAAECVVTPLTLFHFHQYALGGSLTTLVLTPLISGMLVVSAAACVLPCAALFRAIEAANGVCSILNSASAIAAGWYAAPPAASLLAGFGISLLAIALLRGRLRSVAMLVSMFIPIVAALGVAHRGATGVTMTLFDVGQGDSILIRTPSRTILVDGGQRYANVASQLLDRGVRSLDTVVLTHVHPDHCGGLPDVLARLRVGQLWISPRRFRGDCAERLLEIASSQQVPIRLLRDGDRFENVTVFLTKRTFRRSPENNSSVVLRIAIGNRRVLLTGDIEQESESDLAERVGHADVLKVAHHGSRSSTTPSFLAAVAPHVALISCGRHNLFGHPHGEVLKRLEGADARIFRTDRNGAIDVTFAGEHIFVQEQIDTPR